MAAPSSDKQFFGHPRGLQTLFFTEMWERFSYYGMRAFLIFYIIAPVEAGGLGKSEATGGIILAMYVSLVYLMSLPGGWIADRFIGQQKAVFIGGIIIMLGHLTLAIPGEAPFLPGLAIIVLGTGLLKPNVSTIVGQLYDKNDIRRDSGYTIYYMGINVGAGVAPFVCGYLAKTESFRRHLHDWGIDPHWAWHFGFASAAVGMLFGVVQFWMGRKYFGEAGLHPTKAEPKAGGSRMSSFALAVVAGAAALIAAFAAWRIGTAGVSDATIADSFGVGLALVSVAVFWIMHRDVARDEDERRRVRAMGVLFFGCLAFFGIFEQASSTLNLYTDHYVKPKLFFVNFDSTWYQSINAVWILILGPVFAAIWIAMAKARKEPDAVTKFALGVLLSGIAFFVLLPTVGAIAGDHKISGYWFVAFYFITTCGELCLSPVGLSVMNKLAPVRLEGFVMGIWFLAISIGGYIAGRAGEEVGGLAKRLEWGAPVTLVSQAKDGAISISTSYPAGMFWLLIIFTGVVAAALFAMAGPVKRMLAASEPELPEAKVTT